MPQTVSTIDILQQYICGVMDRAEHHARAVDEVCLTIAGAIVWRTEGDPKVLTRDGEMKNVLWVTIDGARYALSFNHELSQIEVRKKSTQGNCLAEFTNENSAAEVKQFFASL